MLRWFRNRELKNLAAKNATHKLYGGFNEVKKIGLFIDGLCGQESAAALFNEHFTKKEQKALTVFAYMPLKKKVIDLDYPYLHLAKNQKNWLGIPKGEDLDQFVNQDYDVVLDFTHLNLIAHQFVRAQLQCKLLVAVGETPLAGADIQIRVNPARDTASALSQSLKYLKLINSTKNG